MRRESSDLDPAQFGLADKSRRRDALEILLEARERLLEQMTHEILAHGDALLDESQDGVFSFEFQEIEDRYGARLQALNALLEHLECRQPSIRNRVETFQCERSGVKRNLLRLLEQHEDWDLADFEIVSEDAERVFVVVVFTRDEYGE